MKGWDAVVGVMNVEAVHFPTWSLVSVDCLGFVEEHLHGCWGPHFRRDEVLMVVDLLQFMEGWVHWCEVLVHSPATMTTTLVLKPGKQFTLGNQNRHVQISDQSRILAMYKPTPPVRRTPWDTLQTQLCKAHFSTIEVVNLQPKPPIVWGGV